jgi:tetraacyldisaccharide 4'-kinase
MVVIGTDRYASGKLAMQQLVPDIFLLDDGFQHLRLHRDLNILLLDYSRPFGNGLALPAGILREPSAAVRRADLIIFTRAPAGAATPAESGNIPACVSSHTTVDLLPLNGGAPLAFSHLNGSTVLAFAGIADPDSFFAGLRDQGLTLAHCLNFPDHVVYDRERCDEIAVAMKGSGADYLITTEKDGVKLKGLPEDCAGRTLLARLELAIDNPDLLKEKLNKLLQA